MSDWADASTEELVELMDENYYTLASTGQDAFSAFMDDVARGAFTEYHGMTEQQVALLTYEFAKRMYSVWDIQSMTFYVKARQAQ